MIGMCENDRLTSPLCENIYCLHHRSAQSPKPTFSTSQFGLLYLLNISTQYMPRLCVMSDTLCGHETALWWMVWWMMAEGIQQIAALQPALRISHFDESTRCFRSVRDIVDFVGSFIITSPTPYTRGCYGRFEGPRLHTRDIWLTKSWEVV